MLHLELHIDLDWMNIGGESLEAEDKRYFITLVSLQRSVRLVHKLKGFRFPGCDGGNVNHRDQVVLSDRAMSWSTMFNIVHCDFVSSYPILKPDVFKIDLELFFPD
jgi:hypothetical protein